MIGSETLCPLTDKSLILEGFCSVLFGKVSNHGTHHLISNLPIYSTVEPPTRIIQCKVEEENSLVDSRDIANQWPP